VFFICIVGAKFGLGVYFATSAEYSHGYANQERGTGHRRMLLADVVTGRYTQGNPEMKVPPRINATSPDNYDSTVDNISNPSMYVVFKDGSVYPLYVLTYNVSGSSTIF